MVLIILTYITSSIIFTYPLVLRLGEFLPGQPNDAYVYLWNIWNFWNQISSGHNPFFTNFVMYPVGTNLFFHTYAPFVSLFALPFLKNLSFFTGIAIIIAISLSSISMYLLSLKITQNKIASFIAGLIYGVSPIIHSFIQSQHYYFLFSSIFYPLGILGLITYFEKNKLRYLYTTTFIFWIVLAIDYYSAVLYSLLIIIFVISNVKLNLNQIKRFLMVGIIAIIIPFILLYTLEINFKQFVEHKQSVNSSSTCNTNLLGFVTPNISNPLIGFGQNLNLDTPSYFLGWGILVIAVISFRKYSKQKYIKGFLCVFITFLVLSLGTNIKIGTINILKDIYTPFYYFLKIPILNAIDCPIRFPILIQLCIAIFIALFISKHKKVVRTATAIFILLLIEYGVININFSSTTIPEVYIYLSQENNSKTLLEIPSGISESKSAFGYDWSIQALHSQQMYWQTVHHKPRVGVYMSRLTPDKYNFFKSEPVISDIFAYSSSGGQKPESDIPEEDIENFIEKFNLGYIILSPNPRQNEFLKFVENEFKDHISEMKIFKDFIYYKLD